MAYFVLDRFFPIKFDCFNFHEVWGLDFFSSLLGIYKYHREEALEAV